MPNQLCHFELMSSDPAKAMAFYGAVFGWQFDDASMPGYTLIDTGAEPTGAVFPKPPDAPAACLNAYFKVEDIDAVLKTVTEQGGKTLIPNTTIPNVGQFAMFADPEDIPIGIMQPLEG